MRRLDLDVQLLAVLLWLPRPWRIGDAVVALACALVLVKTHETIVFTSVVVVVWGALRAWDARTRLERGACAGVATRQLAIVEAAFLGGEQEGRELLAPLHALDPELDTFATIPAAALTELHRDPPQPVPGVGNGWLLRDLDVEAVAALVTTAAMDGTSPLVSVEVRHLEGALGRPHPNGGALAQLDGAFALHAVGSPLGPVTPEAIDGAIDDLAWALAPWAAGRSFPNFTDRASDPRTFYGRDVLDRLRIVRDAVDPDRRMLASHSL